MNRKKQRERANLPEILKVGKVFSLNKLFKLTKGIGVWVLTTKPSMYMPLDKELMSISLKRDWKKYGEKNYWVRITHNWGLNNNANVVHVEHIEKKSKKHKHAKSKNLQSKSFRKRRYS